MYRPRFEKFEMKYGYYFPEDFKNFMTKYGGDIQFGSCRFEYTDNIINNLIRIPGEMDFHLIPFGDVGNGDYYCFYRYGAGINDYFVGIWLHETGNFVILSSTFRSFMYKCLLDDQLSTVVPNDELSEADYKEALEESSSRTKILSEEFGFDLRKVSKMKNEFDYHRLMVEYDDRAVQSLCFLGKSLINKKDISGFDLLEKAITTAPFYTAPYYLLGKTYIRLGRDEGKYIQDALKTSLVSTGYSYWQEDYLEIPEDIHREIALMLDASLERSDGYLERELYRGRDPYDSELRYELGRKFSYKKNFTKAMLEYNNAILCSNNKDDSREILKDSLRDSRSGGLNYLTNIIEHDIKMLR